jgi:flagellar hook protein FlgE
MKIICNAFIQIIYYSCLYLWIYANGQISGTNGAGEVMKNHLEMSNVDLAREFVDLIVTQKAFQANSRVISSTSEMLSEVINIIR